MLGYPMSALAGRTGLLRRRSSTRTIATASTPQLVRVLAQDGEKLERRVPDVRPRRAHGHGASTICTLVRDGSAAKRSTYRGTSTTSAPGGSSRSSCARRRSSRRSASSPPESRTRSTRRSSTSATTSVRRDAVATCMRAASTTYRERRCRATRRRLARRRGRRGARRPRLPARAAPGRARAAGGRPPRRHHRARDEGVRPPGNGGEEPVDLNKAIETTLVVPQTSTSTWPTSRPTSPTAARALPPARSTR